MKRTLKIILPFIVFAILLLCISAVNTIYVKSAKNNNELKYYNLLRSNIKSGNIEEINYEYLINDIETVNLILEDMLNADVDIKKKTGYYEIAENVYDNKLNEISAVLNEKLDDSDFEDLQIDIDEFRNLLNFEIKEITSNIKSTIDLEYNVNKKLYEMKKNKCKELIEKYKGFLAKKE